MKHEITILALILACSFACCSRSPSEEWTSGPQLVDAFGSAGPCPHPYLPLIKGARWTYQLGEDSTRSTRAELEVVEVQTKGRAIDAKVKRTVGPSVTTVEATCGSDGASFLALFVPLGPPLPVNLNYVPRITKRDGALLIPASLLQPNKSWSYSLVANTSNPGGQSLTMDSEWSVKVRYAGRQKVTVPIGSYEVTQISLDVSGHHRPPEEEDVTFSQQVMDPPQMSFTYSLAKGVGVVLIEGEPVSGTRAKRAYWALADLGRP